MKLSGFPVTVPCRHFALSSPYTLTRNSTEFISFCLLLKPHNLPFRMKSLNAAKLNVYHFFVRRNVTTFPQCITNPEIYLEISSTDYVIFLVEALIFRRLITRNINCVEYSKFYSVCHIFFYSLKCRLLVFQTVTKQLRLHLSPRFKF